MNSRNTFAFSVLTLITSLIWLGVSIYYSYNPPIPGTVESKITNSINIKEFPKQTLQDISKKTLPIDINQ